MSPGKKLAIGIGVVVGVTSYLAYLGAVGSWRYYLTVDECLATQWTPPGPRVRVSGRIAAGSLNIAAGRGRAEFSLEGTTGDLAVTCSGPLPDNLSAGADVVVEGRLDGPGRLRAQNVLTRCAARYESRPRAVTWQDTVSSSTKGDS